MDSRAERVKEKLYPLVSRKSDDSSQPFSSTLLVPFAVLGTPNRRVPKKWYGTVRYFGTIHNF